MENISSKKESMKCTDKAPKYYVCIEGTEYPWADKTISMSDVADLGGWDTSIGVIEIDRDNNERTVSAGEVVELKPGHGFSKKVCWKRGLDVYEARLEDELNHLQSKYPEIDYVKDGRWVLIPNYHHGEGWFPEVGPIVFQLPDSPTTPPYAFYVPSGIKFNGNIPTNYQEQANPKLPFEGNWGVFSWAPDNGHWRPGATVSSGSNMLNWAMGFKSRFKEGA